MVGNVNGKKTPRQQDIVNAARKIITSQGTKSLTVRVIAKELGITDGALYRHFKSKNDIMALLIDDIEVTLLSAVDDAARRSKDPLKKLENIFFSHLSYAEQRKGVTFVIINETLSMKNKGLQEKMRRVVDKYLKTIKGILTDGVVSGAFRSDIDVDSASVVFFGAIQSTVTLWALGGFSFPLRNNRLNKTFGLYKKAIEKGGSN